MAMAEIHFKQFELAQQHLYIASSLSKTIDEGEVGGENQY
jgi:hypothetical protein